MESFPPECIAENKADLVPWAGSSETKERGADEYDAPDWLAVMICGSRGEVDDDDFIWQMMVRELLSPHHWHLSLVRMFI